MTFDRLTVAVGTAAALAIAAIAVFVPWHGGIVTAPAATLVAASKSHPIAQPITPGGWPYSQLAVLRQQRMSDDVLPASVATDTFVAESARRLGEVDGQTAWVVVDGLQEVCVLFTEAGDGGNASMCGSATSAKPGAALFGAGVEDFELTLFADGEVKSHETAGQRQLANNTWVTGAKSVEPARSLTGDGFRINTEALASRHFEILRRPRTSADAMPESWRDNGHFYARLDMSTLHYAGKVAGGRAWVASDLTGHACLVGAWEDSAVGITCDSDRSSRSGHAVAAFASDGGTWILVTDGTPGKDELDADDAKVAPNVWASVSA